jgi:hypothetical protein
MTDKLREALNKVNFQLGQPGTEDTGFLVELSDFLSEAISTSEEWHQPDETTPKMAIVWVLFDTSWIPMPLGRWENTYSNHLCLLAKENQDPPPEDYRP